MTQESVSKSSIMFASLYVGLLNLAIFSSFSVHVRPLATQCGLDNYFDWMVLASLQSAILAYVVLRYGTRWLMAAALHFFGTYFVAAAAVSEAMALGQGCQESWSAFSTGGLFPFWLFTAMPGVAVIPFAWRLARTNSRETLDITLRKCGFMGAVGIAFLAVGAHMSHVSDPTARIAWSPYLEGAVFALCLAAILVSASRIIARRRWLARVLRDQEPGWSVLRADALTADLSGTLPLFSGGEKENLDGVIMRRKAARPQGVYRTGEEQEPYALVQLPGDGGVMTRGYAISLTTGPTHQEATEAPEDQRRGRPIGAADP